MLDAVVCGHLHDPGDDEYDWEIGDEDWAADVYLVGRTGGMDETRACFGVIEVPATGKLGWKMVRFNGG